MDATKAVASAAIPRLGQVGSLWRLPLPAAPQRRSGLRRNTNRVTQPPAAPVQVWPVAMVDPDGEQGFRIGFRNYFDPCASLGAEYWHFENNTAAVASTDVTAVIQSLVTHPGTASAARTWEEASAGWTSILTG